MCLEHQDHQQDAQGSSAVVTEYYSENSTPKAWVRKSPSYQNMKFWKWFLIFFGDVSV